MKKSLLLTSTVALFLVAAPPSAAQDLTLTLNDGRVTLIADNVPVSRILAEWARVGQATVLNGEKVTGPPVTLHFENQPEREVLEVLLRSASGYIVAPRQAAMANASSFDRILIMPPSRPPAVSAVPPPQFARPPAQPMPMPIDADEQPNDPVQPPNVMPQPDPNFPTAQPVPGMPIQQQLPATQPRPGMPTGVPGGPGGVQPNPGGMPPLPPGVRPPGGGEG